MLPKRKCQQEEIGVRMKRSRLKFISIKTKHRNDTKNYKRQRNYVVNLK